MSDHEWHDITRYNFLIMPQKSMRKLYNIKSISHHYNLIDCNDPPGIYLFLNLGIHKGIF